MDGHPLQKERLNGIVDWLLKIVYEESIVSAIGRACLSEIGYKSRWWAKCNQLCEKFHLRVLVDVLWLRNIVRREWSMTGMYGRRSMLR